MFGWFRFVAALMVVLTHIGGVEFVAGVAVWGFFMLSGFLMTAVLQRRYGLTVDGISVFALSRAWRLLPSYWVSILLSFAAISIGSDWLAPELFNPALAIPETLREMMASVFIVGHTTLGLGRVDKALSPSAWAVDVEILMYACSCLFLARSARWAKWTLVVLLLCFIGLWLLARNFVAAGELSFASQLLYSFLPAALLPYSIGTLLWFSRDQIPGWMQQRGAILSGCAGLFVCATLVFPRSVTIAFLATLPCLVLILSFLAAQTGSLRQRAIDDFVGRMAYPIYLLHWLGAYVVGLIFAGNDVLYDVAGDRADFAPAGVLVVTALTVGVSALLAFVVEGPLDRARHGWLSRRRVGAS